jgi:hypothetical protein
MQFRHRGLLKAQVAAVEPRREFIEAYELWTGIIDI